MVMRIVAACAPVKASNRTTADVSVRVLGVVSIIAALL
jgi:hypothetical protein